MSATTVATAIARPHFTELCGSLLSMADQGGAALVGSTKATPVLLKGALARAGRL